MTPADRLERFERLRDGLENYSSLFSSLVSLGQVGFTESINTAAVEMLKGEDKQFFRLLWNPKFFDFNSDYKNSFILCHEMLHVLLKHGNRSKGLNPKKSNICQDISINHMLIDNFGFKRFLIEGWEEACWRDTVFLAEVPALPSFESYYAIPDEKFKPEFLSRGFFLDEIFSSEISQDDEKKIEKERNDLFSDLPSYGDESELTEATIEVKKRKKPKFENLVKNLVSSVTNSRNSILSEYSWATIDRRFAELCPDFPCDKEIYHRKVEKKYVCYCYVDNSGSCADYIQKFCDTVSGLNKNIFEVALFSFDTKIHEIIADKDGKYSVRGGGGTDFSPVVKHINENKPDIAFVLTDGIAEPPITNSRKHATHWFISENGSSYALKGSGKIWKLSQYA